MSSIFDPPKPPNPVKVANAAAAANKETAIAEANLANVNQVTPTGNLTYSVTGKNADGTPQYQATQTYSPEQQKIYEQNAANSLLASTTGGNQLQAVSGQLSKPFTLTPTPQQSNIDLQTNAGLGQVSLNQNLGQQGNLGQRTDLGLEGNLNYGGAPSLDDNAVADRIQRLGQERLDPRFAREQQTLESDLANRGVVPGTEAYARAQEQFNQSKNDAYNQLALEGQNQMFQEQATRRGVSTQETQEQLQARNAAQQANQGFYNDANLQNFQEANAANAANANFANQNELAQTQANNAANLAQGQFGNAATQSEQQFNNATLAANRDRATQDALLQRQTPLNEFSALTSGSQVSQPNFVNTPQPGVQAVDVAGIYNNNYAQQSAQYNAMIGGLAGIGGAVAKAGIPAAFPTSDRRAKKNVHKLGSLAKGINLYEFEYKPNVIADGGLRHIGAMAQEVEKEIPEAVHENADTGYKSVDYNRVFAELGA
jgi:hypothetical protein